MLAVTCGLTLINCRGLGDKEEKLSSDFVIFSDICCKSDVVAFDFS